MSMVYYFGLGRWWNDEETQGMKFIDVPLGTKFRFNDHERDVFVLLDHVGPDGCGVVATVVSILDDPNTQKIFSATASAAALETFEVDPIADYTFYVVLQTQVAELKKKLKKVEDENMQMLCDSFDHKERKDEVDEASELLLIYMCAEDGGEEVLPTVKKSALLFVNKHKE